MEKKLVAVVRYYEHMYVITEKKTGERLYTGNDEKVAKHVLTILNGYNFRRERAKQKAKRQGKRRRPK